MPQQLRGAGVVVGRPGLDDARGAHLPAVVGPDVVDALFHQRVGDADLRAADLRGVDSAEALYLRGIGRRVEVADDEVRVAARADVPRHALELLVAALAVELSPRREVRD